MSYTTPEQVSAPPPIATGRFPYGWRAIPVEKLLDLNWSGRVVTTQSEDTDSALLPPLKKEYLPFPQTYRKEFSHLPRTILLGAPRRGGKFVALTAAREEAPPLPGMLPLTRRQTKRCNECKPTRYIVWPDRSIRRVDKLLRKQFEGMTQDEQVEFLNKALQ